VGLPDDSQRLRLNAPQAGSSDYLSVALLVKKTVMFDFFQVPVKDTESSRNSRARRANVHPIRSLDSGANPVVPPLFDQGGVP
jgi:hypothetical protein